MYATTSIQTLLISKTLKKRLLKSRKILSRRNSEIAVKSNVKDNETAKVFFKPDVVTFYEEIKNGNKTSYTFVEAMILLSAFLAAHNKESNDESMFSLIRSVKTKVSKKKNAGDHHIISHIELGKTKKFSMERMLTIFQFFISNFCEKSEEERMYHHSINVYSKINTFVSENLFKRSQGRNEDPSAVSLKINYDKHMIEEVLKQFSNIKLHEFLDTK